MTRNSKDPRFVPPVDLPHVRPQDYSKKVESGNGSAAAADDGKHKLDAEPPYYTLPGRVTGEKSSNIKKQKKLK